MKLQLETLVQQMRADGIPYGEAVKEFKKAFILHVLQERNGNQSKAALSLCMHRNTLGRTLSELQIELPPRGTIRRPTVGVSPSLAVTNKRFYR